MMNKAKARNVTVAETFYFYDILFLLNLYLIEK